MPRRCAATRSACQSGTGSLLPFNGMGAAVGVCDRGLGCPPCRLADEHGARRRGGLDARGGVDEVARDHPLVGRAEADGGLAGEDAGPSLEGGVEPRDRVDQLERSPNGPLGVVLVRNGSAPDGHHRVADELLDSAAVALDDRAGGVEVAGQELARVLGVAPLRGGREADQVGEQDGDESSLRYRRRGSRGVGEPAAAER